MGGCGEKHGNKSGQTLQARNRAAIPGSRQGDGQGQIARAGMKEQRGREPVGRGWKREEPASEALAHAACSGRRWGRGAGA